MHPNNVQKNIIYAFLLKKKNQNIFRIKKLKNKMIKYNNIILKYIIIYKYVFDFYKLLFLNFFNILYILI
jgi:hypothetical protein